MPCSRMNVVLIYGAANRGRKVSVWRWSYVVKEHRKMLRSESHSNIFVAGIAFGSEDVR
jgi:hypothetical protein